MSSTPSTSRDPLAHERGIISRAMRQLPMQPGALVTLADHVLLDGAIGRVLEIQATTDLEDPHRARLLYTVSWPDRRSTTHAAAELSPHITQGGTP